MDNTSSTESEKFEFKDQVQYRLNGQLHREDGPAIEFTDHTKSKYWYWCGQPHREDGPAVEWSSGYKEWWINGIQVTKLKVLARLVSNPRFDLSDYSDFDEEDLEALLEEHLT